MTAREVMRPILGRNFNLLSTRRHLHRVEGSLSVSPPVSLFLVALYAASDPCAACGSQSFNNANRNFVIKICSKKLDMAFLELCME